MTIRSDIASARPFSFDTEFDDRGDVRAARAYQPAKRAYLPAEVDALVAAARLEAREAALAEIESLRAMAKVEIAQAMAVAMPALASAVQAHRDHAAQLALAAARVIAGTALDRSPQAPLRAALEALGAEIDASPRLVVRARGLDDQAREALQAVAADAGFTGLLAFREDHAMPVAAFQLEWADGRADFDPAEAAGRIQSTLAAALAAEGGHGEALELAGADRRHF